MLIWYNINNTMKTPSPQKKLVNVSTMLVWYHINKNHEAKIEMLSYFKCAFFSLIHCFTEQFSRIFFKLCKVKQSQKQTRSLVCFSCSREMTKCNYHCIHFTACLSVVLVPFNCRTLPHVDFMTWLCDCKWKKH